MRGARRFAAVVVATSAAVTFVPAGPAAAAPYCKGLTVTIHGGPRDDRLRGTRGRDVIHAGPGNDVVFGQAANDVLCGGPGRDVITGGPGNDLLDGGKGHDAVSFESARRRVTIDLANHVASGQGVDGLVSVASAVGGRGDDDIRGTRKTNVLVGGLGDDRLLGLGGTDVLEPLEGDDFVDGGPGKDVLSYALSTGAVAVHTRRGLGTQRVRSTEALQGSPFSDVIRGTDADDVLLGGFGGDQFWPRGGDDLVDGQGPVTEFDEVLFDDAPRGVEVALELERVRGHLVGEATGDGRDAFVDVDGAVGSRFDDALVGTKGETSLAGLGGDDSIGVPGAGVASGGAGADVIAGTGRLSGDEGNDTLRASGASELAGGPGDDVLEGGADLDLFVPGPGDDVVSGGEPSPASDELTWEVGDAVSFAEAPEGMVVDLGAGTAFGEGADELDGIEGAAGSAFDDVITGSSVQNLLSGGAGADRLDGLGASDRVYGDEGNDTMYGGDGDDQLVGGEGFNTADGGPGDDDCSADQQLSCENVFFTREGRRLVPQASRPERHFLKISHAMAESGSVTRPASPISALRNLIRLIVPR